MTVLTQHDRINDLISVIYNNVLEQCWEVSLKHPNKESFIQELIEDVNSASVVMQRKLNYVQQLSGSNNSSVSFSSLQTEVEDSSQVFLRKLKKIVTD